MVEAPSSEIPNTGIPRTLQDIINKVVEPKNPIRFTIPTQGVITSPGFENIGAFNARTKIKPEKGVEIPLTAHLKNHSSDIVKLAIESQLHDVQSMEGKNKILDDHKDELEAMGFGEAKFTKSGLRLTPKEARGNDTDQNAQKDQENIKRFAFFLSAVTSDIPALCIVKEMEPKLLRPQATTKTIETFIARFGKGIPVGTLMQTVRQSLVETFVDAVESEKRKMQTDLENQNAQNRINSLKVYKRVHEPASPLEATARKIAEGTTAEGMTEVLYGEHLIQKTDENGKLLPVDNVVLLDWLAAKYTDVYIPPRFLVEEQREIAACNDERRNIDLADLVRLIPNADGTYVLNRNKEFAELGKKRNVLTRESNVRQRRQIMTMVLLEQRGINLEAHYKNDPGMLAFVKRMKSDSEDGTNLYKTYTAEVAKRAAEIDKKPLALTEVQPRLIYDFVTQVAKEERKTLSPKTKAVIDEITQCIELPGMKDFETALVKLKLSSSNREIIKDYFDNRQKARARELSAEERTTRGFDTATKRREADRRPVDEGIFKRVGIHLDDAAKGLEVLKTPAIKGLENILRSQAENPIVDHKEQEKLRKETRVAEEKTYTDPGTGETKKYQGVSSTGIGTQLVNVELKPDEHGKAQRTITVELESDGNKYVEEGASFTKAVTPQGSLEAVQTRLEQAFAAPDTRTALEKTAAVSPAQPSPKPVPLTHPPAVIKKDDQVGTAVTKIRAAIVNKPVEDTPSGVDIPRDEESPLPPTTIPEPPEEPPMTGLTEAEYKAKITTEKNKEAAQKVADFKTEVYGAVIPLSADEHADMLTKNLSLTPKGKKIIDQTAAALAKDSITPEQIDTYQEAVNEMATQLQTALQSIGNTVQIDKTTLTNVLFLNYLHPEMNRVFIDEVNTAKSVPETAAKVNASAKFQEAKTNLPAFAQAIVDNKLNVHYIAVVNHAVDAISIELEPQRALRATVRDAVRNEILAELQIQAIRLKTAAATPAPTPLPTPPLAQPPPAQPAAPAETTPPLAVFETVQQIPDYAKFHRPTEKEPFRIAVKRRPDGSSRLYVYRTELDASGAVTGEIVDLGDKTVKEAIADYRDESSSSDLAPEARKQALIELKRIQAAQLLTRPQTKPLSTDEIHTVIAAAIEYEIASHPLIWSGMEEKAQSDFITHLVQTEMKSTTPYYNFSNDGGRRHAATDLVNQLYDYDEDVKRLEMTGNVGDINATLYDKRKNPNYEMVVNTVTGQIRKAYESSKTTQQTPPQKVETPAAVKPPVKEESPAEAVISGLPTVVSSPVPLSTPLPQSTPADRTAGVEPVIRPVEQIRPVETDLSVKQLTPTEATTAIPEPALQPDPFREAEKKFKELKGKAGSRADLEEGTQTATHIEINGEPWEINPRTGKWMYFDGAEWIHHDPPYKERGGTEASVQTPTPATAATKPTAAATEPAQPTEPEIEQPTSAEPTPQADEATATLHISGPEEKELEVAVVTQRLEKKLAKSEVQEALTTLGIKENGRISLESSGSSGEQKWHAHYTVDLMILSSIGEQTNTALAVLAQELPELDIKNATVNLGLGSTNGALKIPNEPLESIRIESGSQTVRIEGVLTDILELHAGVQCHLLAVPPETAFSVKEIRLQPGAELHIDEGCIDRLPDHTVRLAVGQNAKIIARHTTLPEQTYEISGYAGQQLYKATRENGRFIFQPVTEQGRPIINFNETAEPYILTATPRPDPKQFDPKNPQAFEQQISAAFHDGVIDLNTLDQWLRKIQEHPDPARNMREAVANRLKRNGLTEREYGLLKTLNDVLGIASGGLPARKDAGITDINGLQWRRNRNGEWFYNDRNDWYEAHATNLPGLEKTFCQRASELIKDALILEIPSASSEQLADILQANYFAYLRNGLHLSPQDFFELPVILKDVIQNWSRLEKAGNAARFSPQDPDKFAKIREGIRKYAEGNSPQIDEKTQERYARQLYLAINPERTKRYAVLPEEEKNQKTDNDALAILRLIITLDNLKPSLNLSI